jgi:DNA-binding response OmpR family regulator
MTKLPKAKVNPTNTATILSISPIEDDYTALKEIFNLSHWKEYTDSEWVLHATPTLKSALPVIRNNQVGIVISERDLGPSTWKEVLAELVKLSNSPLLIVSSRSADEYLWAEALNLGAHDVLTKPFDAEEVVRVLTFACERWKNRPESQREWQPRATMVATV